MASLGAYFTLYFISNIGTEKSKLLLLKEQLLLVNGEGDNSICVSRGIRHHHIMDVMKTEWKTSVPHKQLETRS